MVGVAVNNGFFVGQGQLPGVDNSPFGLMAQPGFCLEHGSPLLIWTMPNVGVRPPRIPPWGGPGLHILKKKKRRTANFSCYSSTLLDPRAWTLHSHVSEGQTLFFSSEEGGQRKTLPLFQHEEPYPGTCRKWVKGQEACGEDLSLAGAHTARLPFLLTPTQLRGTFGLHCGFRRHLNIDISPDKFSCGSSSTFKMLLSLILQPETQSFPSEGSLTQGTTHIPWVWPIKVCKSQGQQPPARGQAKAEHGGSDFAFLELTLGHVCSHL